MKFEEQFEIREDNFPDGSHLRSIDGNLLVGLCVWEFETDHVRDGYFNNEIIPCFYNGTKHFLLSRIWINKSKGNTQCGGGDKIISFEDGVKLLMDMGAYEWMFQKEDSE